MRSPSERQPAEQEASPTVMQIVDALILCDDPLLDERFQEAISMHPDPEVRATLRTLPSQVSEGSRLTRLAGAEWQRITGESILDDAFKQHAERFLLEALIDSARAQIRLKVFMSRHAPSKEARDLIDSAIVIHRHLVDALATALGRLGEAAYDRASSSTPAAYVGPVDHDGDLRGQVESAIRHMKAKRQEPRALLASSNAVRHLRDQGLLQDDARILGVPVHVDFSWPGIHFALTSEDTATLDDIARNVNHSPQA